MVSNCSTVQHIQFKTLVLIGMLCAFIMMIGITNIHIQHVEGFSVLQTYSRTEHLRD